MPFNSDAQRKAVMAKYPKLSKARLNYLIKDEGKAKREYKALGLNEFSRDEARHEAYFKNIGVSVSG